MQLAAQAKLVRRYWQQPACRSAVGDVPAAAAAARLDILTCCFRRARPQRLCPLLRQDAAARWDCRHCHWLRGPPRGKHCQLSTKALPKHCQPSSRALPKHCQRRVQCTQAAGHVAPQFAPGAYCARRQSACKCECVFLFCPPLHRHRAHRCMPNTCMHPAGCLHVRNLHCPPKNQLQTAPCFSPAPHPNQSCRPKREGWPRHMHGKPWHGVWQANPLHSIYMRDHVLAPHLHSLQLCARPLQPQECTALPLPAVRRVAAMAMPALPPPTWCCVASSLLLPCLR